MLVLSRKINESIYIPEFGIRIIVTDIRGDKARIGIDADKAATICREELIEIGEDGEPVGFRVGEFSCPKCGGALGGSGRGNRGGSGREQSLRERGTDSRVSQRSRNDRPAD